MAMNAAARRMQAPSVIRSITADWRFGCIAGSNVTRS